MVITESFISKISLPEIPRFDAVPVDSILRMEFVPGGVYNIENGGGHKSRILEDGINLRGGSFSRLFFESLSRKIEGCPVSILVNLSGDRSYHVFARVARVFFAALQREKGITVPVQELHKTLEALIERRFLTSEEQDNLSKGIRFSLIQQDYEEDIENNLDERRAIALSSLCTRENRWMQAVRWLAIANGFLLKKQKQLPWQTSNTRISDLVDLEAFWKNITKITGACSELFAVGMEELVDAAAASPFLKEISLKASPGLIRNSLTNLGRFLEKSQHIETFSIAGPAAETFYNEDFSPIVEGLRTNSSVKYFRVLDFSIGDSGVCKIVEAIRTNPNSKIEHIELALTDMTDVAAISLLALLKEKPNLHVRLIDPLGVSWALRNEIEMIYLQRQKFNKGLLRL